MERQHGQDPAAEREPALDESPSAPAPGALGTQAKIAIVAVVLLALVAVLALRGLGSPDPAVQPAVPGGAGQPAPGAGPDPVAAYEQALEAGKPIYVLFHSASCPACIEITQASVDVRPDYADSITFVDVTTSDPRSRPLFTEFSFQYIPTLFFLAPDGSVLDQHTGPLSEADLRTRLDALAEDGF